MAEFAITVREILERPVWVEAESMDQAFRKVEELYEDGVLVLDYSDFAGVEFFASTDDDEEEDACHG